MSADGSREFNGVGGTERSRILFAPTARMVDYQVGEEGLSVLVSRMLEGDNAQSLLRAISSGPTSGAIAWERPANEVELVGSLVRVAELGGGVKRRIRVSDELRSWVKTTLEAGSIPLNPRVGGVSAVGTVTARAMRHVPTMMALGGIPSDVAALLGGDTQVVGSRQEHDKLGALPEDLAGVGNFSFFVPPGSRVVAELLSMLPREGRSPEVSRPSSLDCLVTGSSSMQGFHGLEPSRVAELGQRHDAVVLTGLQNLDSAEATNSYFFVVQKLRQQGPLQALLYSESKHPDMELEALLRLRIGGCVDFFGLNAVEAANLLGKVHRDAVGGNVLRLFPHERRGIEQAAVEADGSGMWGKACEDPSAVVSMALALQNIVRVPMVRVRGRHLDVAVLSGDGFSGEHIAQLIGNLTASRLLGNIKAVLPSGLIRSPEEITQLFNFPEARSMAALCVADEALRGRGFGSISGSLVDTFHMELPGSLHVLATPPLGFFDKSGGTVSAGDIKDTSFFLESIPVLRHGLRESGVARSTPPQ